MLRRRSHQGPTFFGWSQILNFELASVATVKKFFFKCDAGRSGSALIRLKGDMLNSAPDYIFPKHCKFVTHKIKFVFKDSFYMPIMPYNFVNLPPILLNYRSRPHVFKILGAVADPNRIE